jgi:SAM-dependent methyltransferase
MTLRKINLNGDFEMSKEKLNVELYDKLNKQASNLLPNYLMQAFVPDLFNKFNFSSSVDSDECLWKYIDTMQEFRYEDNLNILGNFINEDELDVAEWLIKNVYKYTEKVFRRPSAARNSITRSLISYRYVQIIKKINNLQGGVLEIGPGSGYLGAMLAKSGVEYSSTDISQAFYLYQNNLMHSLFGENFSEGAFLNKKAYDYRSKKIHHIPWWHYADIEFILPDIDIVVVNHVLAEMHPNSLRFFLSRLVNKFKSRESRSPIYILVEGFGNETFHKSNDIIKLFYSFGIRLINNHAFYNGTKILSTISVFVISENEINTTLVFPNIKYKSLLTFRSYIKALFNYFNLNPIEYRYQKNMDLSIDNYLSYKVNPNININNLKSIFDGLESNYAGTEDEKFLSYCKGLL